MSDTTDPESRPLQRAVVVGAGVMGSGIAQTLAVAGLDVVCCDLDPAQLERAATSVRDGRFGIARAITRGKLTEAEGAAALDRLSFSTDSHAAAADADLALEAVPENLALKMALLTDLDGVLPAHAIIATNSSGLAVTAMAGATRRPELVIGWHWSSPAPVMKMAEIVVTRATTDATREAITALARRCGKNPIVVRDNPMAWGYVGNRIYAAALREANAIVAEGITDRDGVDQILVDGWGWPAGPFGMVRGASSGWSPT